MIELTGSEGFTSVEVNGGSFSCPQAAVDEIERLRAERDAAIEALDLAWNKWNVTGYDSNEIRAKVRAVLSGKRTDGESHE